MRFFDFIIVYLACGAPFSVSLLTQTHKWPFENVAAIFLRLLFWPVFAVSLVVKNVAGKDARQSQLDNRIEVIQTKIETLAFVDEPAVSIFEFREIFNRYAGLTRSITVDDAASPPKDLFTVSGHNAPELAAKVLDRRNRERLKFHQGCARNEFIDLINALTERAAGREQIIGLTKELMEILREPQLLNEFEITYGLPQNDFEPPSKADVHAASVTT